MVDECRKCLDVFVKTGGDMEWTKTMSLEELNKVKAKIRIFKCPDCGSETSIVYLVNPR